MTKEAIKSYLAYESAAHSADTKITRIIFNNGETQVAHFIKDSQDEKLMAQNKWILTFLDKPHGLSTINGDDIADLKAGAKPFR